LEEIEKEKGTTWAIFMAKELLKSRANLKSADKTIDNSDAVDTKGDPKNLEEDEIQASMGLPWQLR
jgi:hypothetical protein